MDQWGVYAERDEHDKPTPIHHVVPTIDIDGVQYLSAIHMLSKDCICRPTMEPGDDGHEVWIHHDSDHPGSVEAIDLEQRMKLERERKAAKCP